MARWQRCLGAWTRRPRSERALRSPRVCPALRDGSSEGAQRAMRPDFQLFGAGSWPVFTSKLPQSGARLADSSLRSSERGWSSLARRRLLREIVARRSASEPFGAMERRRRPTRSLRDLGRSSGLPGALRSRRWPMIDEGLGNPAVSARPAGGLRTSRGSTARQRLIPRETVPPSAPSTRPSGLGEADGGGGSQGTVN